MMTFIKILGALAAGATIIAVAVGLYVIVGFALSVMEGKENGKDD